MEIKAAGTAALQSESNEKAGVSERIYQADRRYGRMSVLVDSQVGLLEIRALVDKSPILCAHQKAF